MLESILLFIYLFIYFVYDRMHTLWPENNTEIYIGLIQIIYKKNVKHERLSKQLRETTV